MSLESAFAGRVHPISQAGFGAGKSELYDRVRPSYAPEVLSHIRKAVAKKDNLNIVELGCGTGLFTRSLLEHPEWASSVAKMSCIDPNDGMRAVFAASVDDPRVHLSAGTFDDTGVPDGWADLVVAATAFHWCSNLEETIAELVRITKEGSTMCFLWNSQDRDKAWVQQVTDLTAPYQALTPSGAENLSKWRRLFTLPLYQTHFAAPEDAIVHSTRPTTLEGIIALAFSRSGVAVQPEDAKHQLAAQIKEVIARGEDLVWLDKEEGVIELPFAARITVMQRRTA